MDWTKVKAGEPIEPAVIAWREWRYLLKPLTLLSLSFQIKWDPKVVREEKRIPDNEHYNGIFALKARPERWGWSEIESAGPQDGYILGRVALWGVVWEHERGYRGQYAQPVSFDEARGTDCENVLNLLRIRYRLRGK